jgi:hypothetical protein
MIQRQDHELPLATEEWGWKYHHTGIPTKKVLPGEKYLPQLKFYVSGFDTSPFGIEWMRFEDDSPVDDLIKAVPHLAFVVEDLEKELTKRNLHVLSPPDSITEGIKVAMIEHNGALVELMEFSY